MSIIREFPENQTPPDSIGKNWQKNMKYILNLSRELGMTSITGRRNCLSQ